VSTDRIDEITRAVIGAAIQVHRATGPGLLHSVYLACLTHELLLKGFQIEVEKPLALKYDTLEIRLAYKVDLVVNSTVVVEVKAVRVLTPLDTAQLMTYLRLMKLHVGLLVNFNVELLKHGIRRVVNRQVDPDGRPLAPVIDVKESVEDTLTSLARGF
jgi:GxxExxY protein